MPDLLPRDHHDRRALDAFLAGRLAALLAEILPHNAFYARKFKDAGLDPGSLAFPRDLRKLPFTTKAELLASQEANPPFGEVLTYPVERYTRMHQTSGTAGRPLRWPDTSESWSFVLSCWEEMFRMVGVRPGERLFFPFSFGPFLGFWSAFEAGARAGCLCLPGGGMSSTARLRFLLDMQASVVLCTPTYALHLADVSQKENIDLRKSAVRAVIVAGEPGGSIPATRARIEEGWGARVFDHTGMTETGPLGIECPENPTGLHLLEGVSWPEVLDPLSGEAVPPGTVGELVITTLGRTACPLIRYRTGDLVRIDPNPCPCGRAFVRLQGGILGRADDMVVIRGNNLHPGNLQSLLHRFPELAEYRITVDQSDALTELLVEVEPAPGVEGAALASRVEKAIRDELLFRADVRPVGVGDLPRHEMKARRWVRKTAPGSATGPANS